jgi:hypothetical protein
MQLEDLYLICTLLCQLLTGAVEWIEWLLLIMGVVAGWNLGTETGHHD